MQISLKNLQNDGKLLICTVIFIRNQCEGSASGSGRFISYVPSTEFLGSLDVTA